MSIPIQIDGTYSDLASKLKQHKRVLLRLKGVKADEFNTDNMETHIKVRYGSSSTTYVKCVESYDDCGDAYFLFVDEPENNEQALNLLKQEASL